MKNEPIFMLRKTENKEAKQTFFFLGFCFGKDSMVP